ncbi:MAG: GNAT family N-acetyltransferase [Stenotrophomonas nitritireducens]|uniref:GNAT family N-acetyltransferase n=1 Tax=Stenotrophomonas nitritireducens TaxID=83617 RepID=UPI001AD59D5A|nr:GNAT family N-acetyltransferase [Stenotrophomonas nitritireducens]MBN8791024.1 GNAT family N-acetyltransferase [Stenotrophomonas nitritireducens]MBN8796588.1 GNAT family N-acetyltransferase [Stenotrophomonas nitritireducens]
MISAIAPIGMTADACLALLQNSTIEEHGELMAAMTDPMNALISFQQALATGGVSPQMAELHNDVLVLFDHPNGVPRFTYALVREQSVVAVAVFVPTDPIDGTTCFNSGYAVDQRHRSKGLGKEITQKAFDELTEGFRRAGFPGLYVEAIVSTSNEHSQRLANRLFSDSPTACTDEESGQPALQYVRRLF